MPLPFKKPIKKSFKKIIIVKITFSAKTSLLRGTTAIRGGADTFVFLSHEILGKFRALLFQKKGNRTRQIKQERRTSEAVRPFEPQLELPRMAGVVAETGFWKKPAVKELTRMSIP